MKVIVTIPAYNEEKTLFKVIKDINSVMSKQKYDYKIVVVNDGSIDKTAEVAKQAGATVFSHPYNRGLAETFRTEIKKCLELKADIIVHTDADGQYMAKEIPLLINKVKQGYDLVLGSRFRGKIESMPLMKRIGNKAFSKVISQIAGVKVSDAQTGFRAFTRKVAEAVKITSSYTYTQEQIIKAVRNNFKIAEVPIFFAKRGGKTKSRLMKGPFDYAVKAWINLFRIYRDYDPLKFFGRVGGLFFLVGFIIGVWLVYQVIAFGEIRHYPSMILSALLMITGIQILFFGFLAEMRKNG